MFAEVNKNLNNLETFLNWIGKLQNPWTGLAFVYFCTSSISTEDYKMIKKLEHISGLIKTKYESILFMVTEELVLLEKHF